jgi:hypothetical protein
MSAGAAAPPAGRVRGGHVRLWYRDLISCLQATFATTLIHAGHEPLDVLGSHWEFLFQPGSVRSEEFYYPCRHAGDLGRSLAPNHPVSSRWGRPAHEAAPLEEIRTAVTAGRLVIAAVDNFYLPFRPAFGDVHAAHLIVVWALDEVRGLVYVADAMPPAFRGPIPVADFLRAWSSANPRDTQDAFFSDADIGRRFLTVTIGEPFPRVDAAFLRRVLAANLELFQDRDDTASWAGEAGLRRFLCSLLGRAGDGDSRALEETYPFGWAMQAQSSLHGEFLRTWGARLDLPELREAGRLVEAVAHAWTGLRMTAAHGRHDPVSAVPDLARHAGLLRRQYETAIEAVHEAREAL